MNATKFMFVFLALFSSLHVRGQDIDSDLSKFFPFIRGLNRLSNQISHEKVYLHFDNTSYYQGDNIWFKCYVTSAQNRLSQLSKTLYVELLNPGGEVIDKRILKIENGQCHGDFSLNRYPFYSGFYEVRAYTKYMLNFGDDVIFSRLLPVFDRPKTEGDFEEKRMLAYGALETASFPMKREKPERGQAVNLRFFPEGGNLIQDVASRIAFEATDESGNPVDVSGVVLDVNGQEIAQFATLHEGRGMFTYTPAGTNTDRRRTVAEVEYNGRKYRFDLPSVLPQGVTMEVDNLSHPDSIGIILRKNTNTPSEMLGVVLLSGGKPQKYYFARIEDKAITFSMDKTMLPAGVSQIVLFDSQGEILCNRLIFAGKNDQLDIRANTGKASYRPYEPIDMVFSVTDSEMNPVNATFSVSVRDGANEVESNHNILTDLLLMSEIKGYVRNPSYYFEDDDETRRSALDLLLMVQGWRRYSWKQIAGIEPTEIKYRPEQGIEIHGQILTIPTFGKPAPKPGVDVALLLRQRGEDEESGGYALESVVTDSLGRFAFVAEDVSGRWNMIFSVSEKGRQRNYDIPLDRFFSPNPPGRYRYAELQVNIVPPTNDGLTAEEIPHDGEDDDDTFIVALQDSISRLGIDEKNHLLDEVVVTARRRTKEQDILHNRSTSVAYYDVSSERDNFYDSGGYTGKDIHEILVNMNPNFSSIAGIDIWYKNKQPLFVINYNRSNELPLGFSSSSTYRGPISLYGNISEPVNTVTEAPFAHRVINPKAIKSIYINEDRDAIAPYAPLLPSGMSMERMQIESLYSCAVFIETYDEEDIYADDAKGVRKTWLEGYSMVREFYSPNYSELPPAPDYRRTLYWNPAVTPDENGVASIQFYNNSNSKNLKISAETITPQGMFGIYKEK